MPYVPPSGNLVALNFAGVYTPPAGSLVALEFVPLPPAVAETQYLFPSSIGNQYVPEQVIRNAFEEIFTVGFKSQSLGTHTIVNTLQVMQPSSFRSQAVPSVGLALYTVHAFPSSFSSQAVVGGTITKVNVDLSEMNFMMLLF